MKSDVASTPPRLVEMLDNALRAGMPPSRIREILTERAAATHEPDA